MNGSLQNINKSFVRYHRKCWLFFIYSLMEITLLVDGDNNQFIVPIVATVTLFKTLPYVRKFYWREEHSKIPINLCSVYIIM